MTLLGLGESTVYSCGSWHVLPSQDITNIHTTKHDKQWSSCSETNCLTQTCLSGYFHLICPQNVGLFLGCESNRISQTAGGGDQAWPRPPHSASRRSSAYPARAEASPAYRATVERSELRASYVRKGQKARKRKRGLTGWNG